MKIGDTVIIKSGWGYFDTTKYPLGGCFKRATTDISGTIVRIFDMYCGCDIEIEALDGTKIACKSFNVQFVETH